MNKGADIHSFLNASQATQVIGVGMSDQNILNIVQTIARWFELLIQFLGCYCGQAGIDERQTGFAHDDIHPANRLPGHSIDVLDKFLHNAPRKSATEDYNFELTLRPNR
jgi:hypothetical protein